MLIEQGVITHIEQSEPGALNETIIGVSTAIKTTCGSCQAEANCSTSVVATFFTPQPETFLFRVNEEVCVGQKVELGMSESRLVHASFMLYLLPIIIFVATTMLMSHIFNNGLLGHELVAFTVALLVTFITFILISSWLKRDNAQYTPKLCRIIPMPISSDISVIDLS